MSFNQTREVLDHAREFHRRLGLFYQELLERASKSETRELLKELISHERVMESRLVEYEEEVSSNILDTFFKYMVNGTEQHFAKYEVPAAVDTQYVINATRHFDDCLSRFYDEMSRKALSSQVRDVLDNLTAMERREQITLSKKSLSLDLS